MKAPTREEVRIFPAAADFRRWLEEHLRPQDDRGRAVSIVDGRRLELVTLT